MQAQDYLGSLWAIGLRLKNAIESQVEKAVASKSIVRSWPMRGTLHFVRAGDLRWMLTLLTPRVIQRSLALYKQVELDKKVFLKARKVVINALTNEKQLSRNELYVHLERAKISTEKQRGLHILGHLAQEGLICFGTRKDKQHRFVLLDDWISGSLSLTREEGLAKLAISYFQSHGPATLHDFAWWSGLTVSDAKVALALVDKMLIRSRLAEQEYVMVEGQAISKSFDGAALLPCYDEYFVAYRDRKIGFDERTLAKVKSSGNGIFFPVFLRNGRMAGTWKRTITKEKLLVEVNAFNSLDAEEKNSVAKAGTKLGKFLQMPVSVST